MKEGCTSDWIEGSLCFVEVVKESVHFDLICVWYLFPEISSLFSHISQNEL